LNLLKLTAAIVAQLRAGPPQIVRRNVLQAGSLAAGSDHVPNNVLRQALAPHLSLSRHPAKDFALRDISSTCPLIERGFDPVRNRNGANVASFANQINHGPVPLALLNVIQLQAHQFRSAKATTEQHRQHGQIPLGPHAVATSMFEYFRTLLCAQPVAGAEAELFDSFDAANPGSQFGAQQTGIGGFVCQTTHRCQLLVDRVVGQTPRFQVHVIAHDHDAIESQARLRSVPRDELIDGILVYAA